MHLETLDPVLAAFGLVLVMAGSALAAETAPLRIGYTTDDRAIAKAAGFDYVEIRIGELLKLSESELEQLVLASRAGVPALAAYTFLPGDLKIVGPQVDDARLDGYVAKAFERCGRLGVKLIVFGAGASRNAPDGFSKDEAFRQLVGFGKRVAPGAARHGITIAAQPITRAQTNMCNTAAETVAWVDAVGHPNFQMSLDLYHTIEVGDAPAAAVLTAGPRLKYAKLSNPKGRLFPASAGEYDYGGFLGALRKISYGGPIGLETSTPDALETAGPKSVELLRSLWKALP